MPITECRLRVHDERARVRGTGWRPFKRQSTKSLHQPYTGRMTKIPRTSVQLQQMIIDEMNGMEGCPPNLKMSVEPYQHYWRAKTNLSATKNADDCVSRINAIADRLRYKYDLLD